MENKDEKAPPSDAAPGDAPPVTEPAAQMSTNQIEKLEEEKLKAKYPMAAGGGLSGHSAFLQKKLAKGQKYFDSGDYQMARQTTGPKSRQPFSVSTVLNFGTGDAIPTPESVPVRKTSIIQPKFHPAAPSGPSPQSNT